MNAEISGTGYKKTDVGFIPNDWDVKSIDQIFSFFSTSNYSKAQMTLEGDVGCLHYGLIHAINNTCYNVKSGIKYYVDLQQAKYKFLVDGDIVMVDASEDLSGVNKSVEIIGIGKKIYISGLHTFLLRDKGFLAEYFRGAILNSNIVKAQMLRLAVGMKVYGVSKSQIKTVLLPVPTLLEQTAIAIALSDMDALISQTEKLIEKKKAIKQGAMQELLKPKDGWVTKMLGEIIHLQGGYAFKSEQFKEIGVPIIRISDVGNNEVKTENSVCYEAFNIPLEFIARKGDTLIAMSGATTGKVGVYKNSKIAYINQRVGKFVVLNKNSTCNDFISHVMRSQKFKNNLSKEIAQGAQPNISGKQIESIPISIPNNYQSQEIIAKILSDIDQELLLLNEKLNKLKQQKQGMMQALLTGKIRII
jgi:type I restriction enzyme S subunit